MTSALFTFAGGEGVAAFVVVFPFALVVAAAVFLLLFASGAASAFFPLIFAVFVNQ